jgi:hypothetical protein
MAKREIQARSGTKKRLAAVDLYENSVIKKFELMLSGLFLPIGFRNSAVKLMHFLQP